MDHALLVDLDVAAGQRVVDALEALQIEVDVALVATFAEYYAPRLVFAASWLESYDPFAMYMEFGNVLRRSGGIDFPMDLKLMKLADPFIVELREYVKPLNNREGFRLDGLSFAGHYLEAGYVYRVR